MPLTAVIEADEVRVGFEWLCVRMLQNARPFERTLIYQGGSHRCVVYWHEVHKIWAHLSRIDNRYWCAYGLEDPTSLKQLSITCEINPPLEGKNWQIAGAFARDDDGVSHYIHSGGIGGGIPEVGRTTFLPAYQGEKREVRWPDDSRQEMIVVGSLDDPNLITDVAFFTRAVRYFKLKAQEAHLVAKL